MGIHEFPPAAKNNARKCENRNGARELSRNSTRKNGLDKMEWHGTLIAAH
jgi:hypothetical protein